MSLWVDKYRPTSLLKLDYHKEQAAHLKKLVRVHLSNCNNDGLAMQAKGALVHECLA